MEYLINIFNFKAIEAHRKIHSNNFWLFIIVQTENSNNYGEYACGKTIIQFNFFIITKYDTEDVYIFQILSAYAK